MGDDVIASVCVWKWWHSGDKIEKGLKQSKYFWLFENICCRNSTKTRARKLSLLTLVWKLRNPKNVLVHFVAAHWDFFIFMEKPLNPRKRNYIVCILQYIICITTPLHSISLGLVPQIFISNSVLVFPCRNCLGFILICSFQTRQWKQINSLCNFFY